MAVFQSRMAYVVRARRLTVTARASGCSPFTASKRPAYSQAAVPQHIPLLAKHPLNLPTSHLVRNSTRLACPDKPRFLCSDSENDNVTTELGAEPEQGEPSADGEASTSFAKKTERPAQLPTGELVFLKRSGLAKFITSCRLLFALPWRRFGKGSVLVIELDGDINEKRYGRFGPATSLPQICGALQKAAYDPRVVGVYFKISPLAAGWAKLQELRRYIKLFRQSGKYCAAYITRGGEKEYFLAAACEKLYLPPSANLSLRGLAVSGSFLRGVLDKVGVEPQVKRIGRYKSAGDQLLRSDMSEAHREQLTALLADIYDGFTAAIAEDRDKTVEEVAAMLDEGIYDMQRFKEAGWVTDLKYEDEIIDEELKPMTGGKPDKVRSVKLKKYAAVSPTAFGLVGRKVVAVIRCGGAIVGGAGGPDGSITADDVIKQLRRVGKEKQFVAVVLRIDSPGGDALASDLMWREIRKLANKKPVIASMGDVAASGGYYMAMAADKIVAEPLTITGSIGVVTGKFNLQELYGRVGFAKQVISKGRYAELLSENRGFREEEHALFDASAEFAYEMFRNKAAESRGMSAEDMQAVAQGRVWSGSRALSRGLVDALGGLSRAAAIAKQAAQLGPTDGIALAELSEAKISPLALLSGGASAQAVSPIPALLQLLFSATASPSLGGGGMLGGSGMLGLVALLAARALGGGSSAPVAGSASFGAELLPGLPAAGVGGGPQAVMPDIEVQGVGSVAARSGFGAQAAMPHLVVQGSAELGGPQGALLAEALRDLL